MSITTLPDTTVGARTRRASPNLATIADTKTRPTSPTPMTVVTARTLPNLSTKRHIGIYSPSVINSSASVEQNITNNEEIAVTPPRDKALNLIKDTTIVPPQNKTLKVIKNTVKKGLIVVTPAMASKCTSVLAVMSQF